MCFLVPSAKNVTRIFTFFGKRCRVLTKAVFPHLRALSNNFTRPFAQKQESQEVYSFMAPGTFFQSSRLHPFGDSCLAELFLIASDIF
jgi:hypothetical protein